MFSNRESNRLNGERKFISWLLLGIMLLLSNSKYIEAHGILSYQLLNHQPPLRLHQFRSSHASSPLHHHNCRIFQQCGDSDKLYSNTLHNSHVNLNKQGVGFTANPHPYLLTSRTLPAQNNAFVTPYLLNNNAFLNRDTNINNHPSLQKTSTYKPETKKGGENKIFKVVSHLLNTKRHFQKDRRFLPHDTENNSFRSGKEKLVKENIRKEITNVPESVESRRKSLLNEFTQGLDKLERKFYLVTFSKLTNMTTGARSENSISFVQSALFLQLLLLALSVGRNIQTKAKIDKTIGIENNISDIERIQLIKDVVSMLPTSSDGLIFRWSSRLVLGHKYNVSEEFNEGPAAALQMHLDRFNGTETPETLSALLNRMVEEDSHGAIHNTFEPDDLTGTVRAVFLTTLYLRSRWRTAVTLLNGTRVFRDSYEDPDRTIRMIRVNDMMRYANFTDCDAEALEVFYLKKGLSLLILVPHGSSLRRLAGYVAEMGLRRITSRLKTLRVAADLPLYTLRMTLLLPNKLDELGLSDLLHVHNNTDYDLKMSHGLQRLMFWAEAGRNAFKDDGIEWDDPPDLRIVIDRPYLFFVRWHNMTLMNGNFVL